MHVRKKQVEVRHCGDGGADNGKAGQTRARCLRDCRRLGCETDRQPSEAVT
jgi:hypothetical protein